MDKISIFDDKQLLKLGYNIFITSYLYIFATEHTNANAR